MAPEGGTRQGASRFLEPVAIGLAFAVSAGVVDATVSLLSRPEGLARPAALLGVISATALLALAAYAAVWLLAVFPFRRPERLPTVAADLAVAAFLFGLFVAIPLAGLQHPSAWPSLIPEMLGSLLLASALAWGAYAAADAMAQVGAHMRSPITVALAAPFLLIELCTAGWLIQFHGESSIGIGIAAVKLGCLMLLMLTAAALRRGVKARVASLVLVVLLLVAATAAVAGLRKPRPPAPSPAAAPHAIKHVILITIDTLRSDALSCYGEHGTQTPEIDRIAADGVRFTHAIAPAPWTLPSVASLMTGLSPAAHTATTIAAKLPDGVHTLAEFMRDAGYRTSGVGSNSFLRSEGNISQGFAEYEFFAKPSLGESLGAQILRRVIGERAYRYASSSMLTRLATSWIRSNAGSDFFFWIHYLDPHDPYEPPPPFRPEGTPPPEIGFRFSQAMSVRSGQVVPGPAAREWIRQLYLGEVRDVDTNVGRLIRTLKKLGLYDDSLIVLTADHGEEFWEHGSVHHGHTLFGELLHVPLIVKLPRARAKSVATAPVSTVGVLPTILELTGIDYDPTDLSARSLVPFWDGTAGDPPRAPLVSEATACYEPRVAVELGGRKFIRNLWTKAEELYDLDGDPGEKKPVAEIPREIHDDFDRILSEHDQEASRLRQRYQVTAEGAKLDPETVERLRALGYVH